MSLEGTVPDFLQLSSKPPSLPSLAGSDLTLLEAVTSEGTRGWQSLPGRGPVVLPPPSMPGQEVLAEPGQAGQGHEAGEPTVIEPLGRWPWGRAMAGHFQENEFLLLNCDFCPSLIPV